MHLHIITERRLVPRRFCDVAIVDVAEGSMLPDRDITIAEGRIASIRPARRREARTRYVMPGLWDMHVELAGGGPRLEKYVAAGVTAVRDMGTDLKLVRGMEARIEKGEMIGPRIFASGEVASSRLIHTPDEARRAFDAYYDQRVDFIAVADMDARSFEALAERSRQDGIPFAGLTPDSVPANVAAEDRMVSMERLSGIGLACSSRQDALRAKLMLAKASDDYAAVEKVSREIEESYDPAAAASLFDLFRRYGVRQTPSLTWWARRPDSMTYDFAAKLTREMARSGVRILAGADGDIDRELEMLVSAGLSPAEALRSATIEPARLMRREDLGQVKQGFEADLLVLRANPLDDIRNTRAIDEVIVRGRKFDGAK